ncbi:MAG: AAA family ATPase [Planctomycetota bacterium]
MSVREHNEFFGSARFEVMRQLGAGGMGVVYEVYDRERGARVALKTLRRVDATAIYRFKHEFRSLTEIVHPNLLPLYELVFDGQQWLFTMELIEGAVDFASYVRNEAELPTNPKKHDLPSAECTTGDFDYHAIWRDAGGNAAELNSSTDEWSAGHDAGAFVYSIIDTTSDSNDFELLPNSLNEAQCGRLRDALRQLAEGVCALHEAGKLHRDLKPGNVLVRTDGHVFLLDFGLVVELLMEAQSFTDDVEGDSVELDDATASHKATDGKIAGTVKYMAPEQVTGAALTAASDWYAVGVMLFEALTGRLPFTGSTQCILSQKQVADAPAPADVATGIPDDLNALCMDLLRRDPQARPSGQQVLARLSPHLATDAPVEDASRVPDRMPFVGRQEHLEKLKAAFDEMMAGQAVVCGVRGRSGSGKSTLIQFFLDRLTRQHGDAVILTGRCYEQESVPYKAVDSLVDALTRYLLRLSPEETFALMPPYIAALARIFPVLQRVKDVSWPADESPDIPDLRELRRRAFIALRELLTRLSERHPLVLYIDDLQWGDVDSATLLSELFEPPDAPRVLLVMSYRSEYAETSACLAALQETPMMGLAGHTLAVEELTPDETTVLALKLLGDDSRQGRRQAASIAAESRGSPLFVYELVRHVKAGGQLTGDVSGLDLDDVLWQRVSQLPDEMRRLLQVISVAGQPVTLRDAYQAAGLESLAPQVVRTLRADHFIRSTGPRLEDDIETFHDRVRESVVAKLTLDSRKCCHASLAGVLEASGKTDAETIAVHFHQSDQHDKAGVYYARAADQAANALAFDRAAHLYELSATLRPLPGGEGRQLRLKLGDALANAGRAKLAADQFVIASNQAEGLERIDLERKAAYQLCAGGHLDEGREILRRVLRRVGVRMPSSQVQALLLLMLRRTRLRMRGLRFKSRSKEQLSAAELARINVTWSASAGMGTKNIIIAPAFQTLNVLLALKAGEPVGIARALCWEAAQTAHDGVGAMPISRKLIDEAARIAAELDDPYLDGMVELAEGVCGFLTGRWQTGGERCDRAARIFRERCTGTSWELGQASTYMLWCMSWEGRFGEMAQRTAEILADARDKGDLFTAANLSTYMAPLSHLTAGDVDAAKQCLAESLSHWSREEYNIQNMTALMGAIPVHLYAGEYRQAYDRIVSEWKDLQRSLILHAQICSVVLPELRVRSALATMAHGASDAALRRDAEKFLKKLERTKTAYARALAAPLRAGLTIMEGDRTKGVQQLESAVTMLEDVNMGLFAASARFRLGQMLGDKRGDSYRADAIDWLERHGIQNPLAMIAAYTPYFNDL